MSEMPPFWRGRVQLWLAVQTGRGPLIPQEDRSRADRAKGLRQIACSLRGGTDLMVSTRHWCADFPLCSYRVLPLTWMAKDSRSFYEMASSVLRDRGSGTKWQSTVTMWLLPVSGGGANFPNTGEQALTLSLGWGRGESQANRALP